jgi:DNA-binding MarR family transcriptional regulator
VGRALIAPARSGDGAPGTIGGVPRRARPAGDELVAWRSFLTAHRSIVDALDRELVDRHGLPLAWYDVLVQLSESPRELTMGELAERLLISPSTCTRVVDRMHASGLVTRRIDERDARVRHIGLAAAGRSRLRVAAVTHLAGIERHFARHLPPGEAPRWAEVLDAMRDSVVAATDD